MTASGTTSSSLQGSGRLPSLDGLRALAVGMVMIAHSNGTAGWPGWWWLDEFRKTANGFAGVQIFFVISGFIITWLLLGEKARDGKISLKQFWLRRFFRIVPPLLVYLATLSLLKMAGHIKVSTLSQAGSLFFFRNHLTYEDSFNVHCWSLSVEEQFYLAWPLLVALLSVRVLRRLAWTVVVASFLARVALSVSGGDNWRWLIFHADCLMAGALGAMWLHEHPNAAVSPLRRRHLVMFLGACGLLLLVCRACSTHLSAYFTPFQPTLVAAVFGFWITRLVRMKEGFAFAVLNQPFVVWVGTVSYGIYLWQQLFTAGPEHWLKGVPAGIHFPLNLALCIAAGGLSYYVVERPLRRLRFGRGRKPGAEVKPHAVESS